MPKATTQQHEKRRMEERLPEKRATRKRVHPRPNLIAAKTRQTFQPSPPQIPQRTNTKKVKQDTDYYSQAEIVQQSTFTAFSRPQMPKKTIPATLCLHIARAGQGSKPVF